MVDNGQKEPKAPFSHYKQYILPKIDQSSQKRNFQDITLPTRHSMIGSLERLKIQRSSIPKLGRFIAAFGSYKSKLSKQSILAKNGQIFVLNGQKLPYWNFPGI